MKIIVIVLFLIVIGVIIYLKKKKKVITTTTKITTLPVSSTTTTIKEGTYNIEIRSKSTVITEEEANVYYSINNGPDILLGKLNYSNMFCKNVGFINVTEGDYLHIGVLNSLNEPVQFGLLQMGVCPDNAIEYCGTYNIPNGGGYVHQINGMNLFGITANSSGDKYITC